MDSHRTSSPNVGIVDNQQVLEQRIVDRRFWAIQCYSTEYNGFVFYALGGLGIAMPRYLPILQVKEKLEM